MTSRTVAGVSVGRREQLHGGASTTTLTEALAIDHVVLLHHVLPDASDDLRERVADAQSLGILARMQGIGAALRAHLGDGRLAELGTHSSDTVRGWVCFAVAADPEFQNVSTVLPQLRPAADDEHFAVREWVWMAARPILTENLAESVDVLAHWTGSESERIRRFASEALRPRGVWAKHIGELKAHPEQGEPILEPLRADPSSPVQDSVANWINDASRSRPDWAQALAERWLQESPTPATARIVGRALRSLRSADIG